MKWFRREPSGLPEVFGKAMDRNHRSGGEIESWSDGVPADSSLVAVTELVIAPGAAVELPAEAGTDVLTWIVEGALTRADVAPHGPGTLLHGSSEGAHRERNEGPEPLRLIRFTVRRDGPPRPGSGPVGAPVIVPGGGVLDVLTQRTELEVVAAHLHTVAGMFSVADTPLRPGDWVRLFTTRTLDGEGTVLAWLPADARSLAWTGGPSRPG